MSSQTSNLVAKIENLRDKIDILRHQIWERDRANQQDAQLERELETLLLEYLSSISAHKDIAC